MIKSSLGFIISRHVTDIKSNEYWKECVRCIRKFYIDEKIVIIDDNSNKEFVTNSEDDTIIVINSEFIGAGEMLPYYYFNKYKWFDKAVIMHDSCFFTQKICFDNIDTVLFLWDFLHWYDENELIKNLLSHISPSEELLKVFNNPDLWLGCFGTMSVITSKFLDTINTKYNFLYLVNHIKTRSDRCQLERVFAIICYCEEKELLKQSSLFGSIFQSPIRWGLSFNEYLKIGTGLLRFLNIPLIKVWTGR